MKDTFTNFFAPLDGAIDFYQDNFKSFLQAQIACVAGFQEIFKEAAALSQANLESLSATAKSILSAKTLEDVVGANVEAAKASHAKLTAGGAKINELAVELSQKVYAPIQARAAAASEVFLKPLAA